MKCKFLSVIFALTIILTANEYSNTSYYVAYDKGDNTQYVLVMPAVNKIYTHKAGHIGVNDLKRIDAEFVSFPDYKSGQLCFSKLKDDSKGLYGAKIMADECYEVKFFYTQKEIVDGKAVFMLYYAPFKKLYEGYAGDAKSFTVARDGNSVYKNDYRNFEFHLENATIFIVADNSEDKKDVGDQDGKDNGESDDSDDSDLDNSDTNNSENTPPPFQKQAVGWYMRTVAKATLGGKEYIHDSAGVFGELKESVNGKDSHDIASYGKATIKVVFTPEWDENNGTYFSDYRAYGNGEKQVWTFQVKNERTGNPSGPVNLKDADLKLSLEGMYDVYDGRKKRFEEVLSKDQSKKTSLTLVDVDNEETYSYSELQNVTLSMDGKHVRTFKWVLGTVEDKDIKATRKQRVSRRGMRQSSIESIHDDFDEKVSKTFSFGLPPE